MKYMMSRQNQSMMHNSYHISYTVPGQLRYQQNIPLHIDKHMYWKHIKTQVLSIYMFKLIAKTILHTYMYVKSVK